MKEFYQGTDTDLDGLLEDIAAWFRNQEYEVESTTTSRMRFLQARKKGTLRTIAGARRAFYVYIEGDPASFKVTTGTGAWLSNLTAAAVVAVLTTGLTILWYAFSMGWTKKIDADLKVFIDERVFGQSQLTSREMEEQKAFEKRLADLTSAFNSGVLTKEELDRKQAALETERTLARKRRDLKTALENGVLTREEYEAKEAALGGEV